MEEKDGSIVSLNERISDLNNCNLKICDENYRLLDENKHFDNIIDDKNNEINLLNSNLKKSNLNLINSKNRIKILENEINVKNDNCQNLSKEIIILKDIIDEKDKTINFLRG